MLLKTQCAPAQVAVCTRPCRFCTSPGCFLCLLVFLFRVCICVPLFFVVVGFLRVDINWKTLLRLRLLELRTVFGLVEPARNIEQVAAIEAAGGFRSLVGCHESLNHLSLGVCVIIRVVRFHKRHPQHDSRKRKMRHRLRVKPTHAVQGPPSLKSTMRGFAEAVS